LTDVLVRAESVTKSFVVADSRVTVLSDVNFEIRAGDLAALSGPSGSGKTTLLHLIAGLERPTSGWIEWPALGDRRDLMPSNVAIAFQGPSLLPPLDVIENVSLPVLLSGAGQSQARARAAEMLDIFELGDLAGKLPEELSGGQMQRVAIARALAPAPRVIIADEPTGQQDHGTGARLMTTLLEVARASGAALIVATHDPSVANLLERRLVLADGALREEVKSPC
jgi:ABC-type lipoprotein export system ATPase subunit